MKTLYTIDYFILCSICMPVSEIYLYTLQVFQKVIGKLWRCLFETFHN